MKTRDEWVIAAVVIMITAVMVYVTRLESGTAPSCRVSLKGIWHDAEGWWIECAGHGKLGPYPLQAQASNIYTAHLADSYPSPEWTG